jgi:hypothetical protein
VPGDTEPKPTSAQQEEFWVCELARSHLTFMDYRRIADQVGADIWLTDAARDRTLRKIDQGQSGIRPAKRGAKAQA